VAPGPVYAGDLDGKGLICSPHSGDYAAFIFRDGIVAMPFVIGLEGTGMFIINMLGKTLIIQKAGRSISRGVPIALRMALLLGTVIGESTKRISNF